MTKKSPLLSAAIAAVVVGCGGGRFTFSEPAADGGGAEDARTVAHGTGGHTSTGGTRSTDGDVADAEPAPTASVDAGTGEASTGGTSSGGSGGGTTATGGASSGGAPATGGVTGSSGGTSSSGGTTATGGASTGGGSSSSGGSSSGGSTACVPVTHRNGLGQTWRDCVPLGTYDQTQAMKACEAYTAASCPVVGHCIVPVAACTSGVNSIEYDGDCGEGKILWTYAPGYQSSGVGHVANTICPTSQDPSWD